MPNFTFKGRGGNGQLVDGEIEGASSTAVAGLLMDRFNLHKISIEELLMFTRQMGALQRAGIPLTRAIAGILESVHNPLLIRALRDILDQLESGRSLSVSCARHPKVFSNLYVSMIQVGENTGRLEETFAQMAEYIDRNRRITQNIKTAMRYPTIVLIAVAIALAILNGFVIPKFADFFRANALELPWQTVLLLNMSEFFIEYWWLMLAAIFAAFVGFKRYTGTVNGRHRWHRFIVNAPVVGDILHRSFMARFARSFAMAYSAGVPIVQAMGVISRSIGNDFIGNHVNGMREGIERGEALTLTAQRTQMFTPVVMQMFAVGEEAGNLDEMMTFVADFYEEEVDYDIKNLSDRIEPFIYIGMGAIVLVLALGIFVPMWDIAQLAGR